MATLEVIAGARHETVYLWENLDVTVGRSPMCDLSVDNDRVSEVHAVIVFRDDRFYVEDLLGAGGVRVNGVPVRTQALCDGAVISLGRRVKLRFTDALEFLAPAPPRTPCTPVRLPVGVLDLRTGRARRKSA